MESMITPKYSRSPVSARDLGERHTLAGAVLGLFAAVVIAVLFTSLPPAHTLGAVAILLLVLAFKGFVGAWEPRTGAGTREEVPFHGNAAPEPFDGQAAPEKSMSESLDQLGDDYLVIYDVRCRFGNLESVILSKDYGVFLVERMALSGENDLAAHTHQRASWLAGELQTITGFKREVPSLVVPANATNKQSLLQTMQMLGEPLPSEVWGEREKIAAQLN